MMATQSRLWHPHQTRHAGIGSALAWLIVLVLGCGGSQGKPRNLVPAESLVFRAPQGFGQYQRNASSPWVLASPGTLMVNAQMTVECRDRRGQGIKKWTGPTQWDGPLPSSYGLSVWPARVIEEVAGIDTSSVRVGMNANGTGGTTLRKWMPKACVSVAIIVVPIDPSTGEGSRDSEQKADDAASSGPGEQRGQGSLKEKRGKLTREEGGVESENARPSGKPYGDAEGRVGGEGDIGDRGVRGAMALFGGLVGVPTAIRSAVEVALIIEEANLLGIGKDFVTRRLKHITDVVRGRELLLVYAQGYAYKARRSLARELRKNPRFSKLSAAEQERALKVIEWKLQEGYFESVRRAAEMEITRLAEALPAMNRAFKKRPTQALKRKFAAIEARLAKAHQLAEAAQVKPMAGRLPVNHAYAGKAMPLDADTVRALKAQGIDARSVPFSPDGYPDFSRWTKADVRITPTGNHAQDVSLAERSAKLPTPKNYTWHHHQELGRMQLIPRTLHQKVGHTGGRATYRHVTADSYKKR